MSPPVGSHPSLHVNDWSVGMWIYTLRLMCTLTSSLANFRIWWCLHFVVKFALKCSVSVFFGVKCAISPIPPKPSAQATVISYDVGKKNWSNFLVFFVDSIMLIAKPAPLSFHSLYRLNCVLRWGKSYDAIRSNQTNIMRQQNL